ncbi:hypothetical protein MBRA1_001950 [Malassezia brasiliensis]|uniref:STAS domain-containing protein n=1 Tax=Malassezia brasiliensis TaxID=1821822 RepID=A0AAF0DTR0_9BASI|nr:hypothetical protein MBRA1_001950 [Malassezia brasiliensis]
MEPTVIGETPARASFWQKAKAFGKKVVRYDDTEANRLGVPMVSVGDFARKHYRNPWYGTLNYIEGLFPFRRWILSYNLTWGMGDLISGITVGLVVVPQSMSYANVAGLKPEFGLYASFVGVVVYALFATSKDVTIGPVAVMSLQTHNAINHVLNTEAGRQYTDHPEIVAMALAFLCGVITLGIGLLRLGWIVEFIPAPAVSGFMTGSALTILAGQLPKLLGESKVNSNDPMYLIVINFFRKLPSAKADAAFGVSALVFLYFVRWMCNWIAKRYPRHARAAFFASVMRSAFVIIILTAASRAWVGTHYDNEKDYPISLILHVPRGFKHMGQPVLDRSLLGALGSELPASVIVLLLEHIAISKSFGRVNNYKINPNQELIAIGVTNMVGPCFGGYAATGSFSRSAIKSKSGVRTPVAGWVTAIVVLIAIYALSGVFYWIPNAALSAVIIHAVGDLIAPPALLYKFWLMNPLELLIFVAAVAVTIFSSVDYGVYVSVCLSAALLLVRIAHPRGHFLGVVHVQHENEGVVSTRQLRDVYVPMDNKDRMRDPSVVIRPPPPGILVYRVEESFTYPNASRMSDVILDKVKAETQPGKVISSVRAGDRPWNDPGPPNPWVIKAWRAMSFYYKRHPDAKSVEETRSEEVQANAHDPRPRLRAIVLDFGSVGNVDTTSVQVLVDLRNAVEIYSGHRVEFHFAQILSPWIRRALLAGDFGTGSIRRHVRELAAVVPEGAVGDPREVGRPRPPPRGVKFVEDGDNEHVETDKRMPSDDIEAQSHIQTEMQCEEDLKNSYSEFTGKPSNDVNSLDHSASINVPVLWNSELTPFFHLDVSGAVSAALESTYTTDIPPSDAASSTAGDAAKATA